MNSRLIIGGGFTRATQRWRFPNSESFQRPDAVERLPIDLNHRTRRRSLQAKRRDCSHNALAQSLVEIFARRGKIGHIKKNRFSDYDRNGHKVQTVTAARQRFVRAEATNRYDRRESFLNYKHQYELSR